MITVVGYVRPAPGDRPGAADGAIIGYATRHNLAMKRIHRDDPTEPGQARRPGFLAALEDLREYRATGVLLPSADHLSPVPHVQDALIRLVEETGGRIYLADTDTTPLRRQHVACAEQSTRAPTAPLNPRPGLVADPGVLPAQAVPNTGHNDHGATP